MCIQVEFTRKGNKDFNDNISCELWLNQSSSRRFDQLW